MPGYEKDWGKFFNLNESNTLTRFGKGMWKVSGKARF
jgi:hypothetical protein